MERNTWMAHRKDNESSYDVYKKGQFVATVISKQKVRDVVIQNLKAHGKAEEFSPNMILFTEVARYIA
jgi:hypothetical protein